DGVDARALQLGDQSGEVLLLLRIGVAHRRLQTGRFHVLLGLIGEALTIGGLVIEDGDLLAGVGLCQPWARERALLVVATASAEDGLYAFRSRALGEGRIGRGRGHLQDALFHIDFRRRDRRAGAEVARDEYDALLHQIIRHLHGLLRIALIVTDFQLDLLAVDAAGRVDVLHRHFGAAT